MLAQSIGFFGWTYVTSGGDQALHFKVADRPGLGAADLGAGIIRELAGAGILAVGQRVEAVGGLVDRQREVEIGAHAGREFAQHVQLRAIRQFPGDRDVKAPEGSSVSICDIQSST